MLEVTAAEWQQALELADDDLPDAVIVEGSWWRAQRQQWRLSYLTDVRELNFPDIFWGHWHDKKIIFCMAYGAPRAVEIIHLFGILGAKLALQIGTCGGLQSHLKTGDIVLPTTAHGHDGVAHLYAQDGIGIGTAAWLQRADDLLQQRDHTTHRGKHLTWSTLFYQNTTLINQWRDAGYLGVDMETATTYAVSNYFDMACASLLVVWDDLTRGRTFLEPLADDEMNALNRANESVYEVALALVDAIE
ncbi:MAG: hypothetical protein D6737_04565 [Chloroflexi bacterium]|nr:MAG: hypothetical protein D6737_04565 [Chloroflexota bacterium]